MLSSMRRDPSGAAPVGGIRGSLGFAQRHIRKIWPIYVIMLLVGVVYQLLYGTLELDFSPLRQIAKSAVLFPVCLTLLQSLTGSTSFSHALNGVCWFLSTIFCIYLISPFIMQFLKRHICKTHEALIGALVCIIASMLLGIVFESITARIAFFDDLDYGSPYRRVFYVILGMLLAQLYTWGRQHDGHGNVIERSGALEYLFIACSMVWFFTRQVVWSSAGPVTYLIDMTLVGGDTYALAVSKGAVSRLLSTRPLVYLGLRWESWTESILRCQQTQVPAVLHGAPVIQVALYPDIPVPSEVGVEHPHELLECNPGPVAAVEELYLQPPEEAL